jgi:hypothetical protein
MNEEIQSLYRMAFEVNDANGSLVGFGMFETELECQGFTKSKLKKYTEQGLFRKMLTRYQGGWRNTYVLPVETETK